MSLSLHRRNGAVTLKDSDGRILMKGEGTDIAIARFPDLSEPIKHYIAELYAELTGDNYDKAKDFLDYKSEEEEFCS